MDNDEIEDRLRSLCRLEIDALGAYTNANSHIDQGDIKNRIMQFQADHGRHIQELSGLIRNRGGDPPEVSADFEDYLLAAFAGLRSVSGTEEALNALKNGEEITAASYGDAVRAGFPPNVAVLLKRNFGDEQRHLKYINQAIVSQAWKKAA